MTPNRSSSPDSSTLITLYPMVFKMRNTARTHWPLSHSAHRRRAMTMLSTAVFSVVTGLSVMSATMRSAVAAEPVTLQIGTQDPAWPLIIEASHVLDGTPYTVKWAVLTGPAAQLSALYAKVLDVGLMGDTSLIVEQGNAREPWTAENAPLQIVAAWRNPDQRFPPIVTAVRSKSGITSLAQLKGHTWGYNFGGFNYLQYVLSYVQADLRPKDFQAVRFGDGNVSASAFVSGQVDVYSGGVGPIKEALDRGDARILLKSDDLQIPALSVFAARRDVLEDAAKRQALGDFLTRLSKAWVCWAAHMREIQQIYQDRIKQTAARAQYAADSGASIFYALDPALFAREQRIADTLAKSGDIKRPIKVDIEFDPQFNAQIVPKP